MEFSASLEGPLAVIEGGGSTPPDQVDEALIQEQFRTHGAILLRGFDTSVESFGSFADNFCSASVFNESRNRVLLDQEANIQSVDLGVDPLPLHPELSREPWRPDACLFACQGAPSDGGETIICDGVEIVKRLPSELVDEMRRRDLLYFWPAAPEIAEFWLGTPSPTAEQLASPPPECPYFFRFDEGLIKRGFLRPLLHKPMFTDDLAWGNFVLFARFALRIAHFPRLENGQFVPDEWVEDVVRAAHPITHAHRWRKGDILILDNSRFMHGRNAILDEGERKIASHFGYIDFAPPNQYEPANAPWRSGTFKPPVRKNRTPLAKPMRAY